MADAFNKVRTWINHRGVVVVAVAVVVAALAILFARAQLGGPRESTPKSLYFIDEVTREIVIEPRDAIPPLPGHGGKPTLVRAIFYTLGSDADKTLGYMEKYTDAGRAILEKRRAVAETMPSEADAPAADVDSLIRGPEEGSEWVPMASPAGQKLIESFSRIATENRRTFRLVFPP